MGTGTAEVNGNGASALVRLVAVAGVSGVIAMFFVWWVTTTVTADVRWSREALDRHNILVQQHVIDSNVAHATQSLNLYLICRAVAQPVDRERCSWK